MKSKYAKVLTISVTILLLILGGLVFGIVWFQNNLLLADGRLYPKNAEFLNLRGQEITVEHYETLRSCFPNCEILWDVPFQGRRYENSISSLAISELTEEDLALIACFPRLKEIKAEGCRDYGTLEALRERYPMLKVDYTVAVDGREYPWDAQTITVRNLTERDVEALEYLPHLRMINAHGCREYSRLGMLRQNYPDCAFSYTVRLDGEDIDTDVTELTLKSRSAQEIAELMIHFPQVETIHLIDPLGEAQPLLALQEERKTLHWDLVWHGTAITVQSGSLDLSETDLQSISELKALLSYLPDTKEVYLGQTGIENEALSAFRETVREHCKVVWTVLCGQIPVRTDALFFHPVQQRVYYLYDEDCINLKYCEDMICVDVGHMSITHCDWVRYMPKLKYLVLGVCGQLKDISALEGCRELVFLELEMTSVRDLSPLLGCTALEDLNLGYTYGDPQTIARMTWLKNLWWSDCHAYARSMLRDALPDTRIETGAGNSTSRGWRKLENYYTMRDVLGMPYME